jgi:hypothetical protein
MTIRIILSKDEQRALEKMAWGERRRTNQQAALIIREKLIERGLLPTNISTPTAQPAQITSTQGVQNDN